MLSDLESETQYTVTVRAYTKQGAGESVTIMETTEESVTTMDTTEESVTTMETTEESTMETTPFRPGTVLFPYTLRFQLCCFIQWYIAYTDAHLGSVVKLV